ncbi:TIR-like protein FxsC [Streptomyces sp. NPDC048409]|uniref:TIR-like protein FxsC n=1 Tax=Streptomyces sp. NPDC048409 TaxID=3154723 RepID=UPI00343DBEB7
MSQAEGTAEVNQPFFFLSYAHTPRFDGSLDPDMWVHRLFADLCNHVMEMSDAPAHVPIGFMDREMKFGASWASQLSEAMATCRVFVPLLSPRYFASEFCGREWSAFSRRETLRATTESPPGPRAVVPALWAPVSGRQLPRVVQGLETGSERFGQEYATLGLYGLMKLRSFREHYERATYRLARSIVEAALQNPLPAGIPEDLAQLPNAFERETDSSFGARRLRIVVAAPSLRELPTGRGETGYGASAVEWNPYRRGAADPRPLATITADLAQRLDFRPEVESLDDAAGTLLDERAALSPTLILLDRWVLLDPHRRALLSRIDDAMLPCLGFVVPANPPGTDDRTSHELQTALEQTLRQTSRRVPGVARTAMAGVPTLDAFSALVPHLMQWVATQFLRFVVVRPPSSPGTPRFRLRASVEEASDDRRP